MLLSSLIVFIAFSAPSLGAPTRPAARWSLEKRWAYGKYFDLQGHRGGRGHTIENTLPSFADGLINGVTSLEMDMGLTKDGVLVIWHDENIDPTKCSDTKAVVANDPMFPYVGKYIANLTLAQIKTLDCGSKRLDGFPLQITVPGTKISTVDEMFDFVQCATDEPVLFNMETKVDGDFRNLTRSPDDFVTTFAKLLSARGADIIDRVTHQSFDWRGLIISKRLMPSLRTSALCDDTTIYRNLKVGPTPALTTTGNLSVHGTGPSNWLAGIDIDSFDGSSVGERVSEAAYSIKADFLSPVATAYASNVTDVNMAGFVPFTTAAMVNSSHTLGLQVKTWTPNRLNLIEYLVDLGVDGLITDFPRDVRIWAIQQGLSVAPVSSPERVMTCLKQHNQLAV